MSKRKLEIEILMNIKKALAAYEQLQSESNEFSAEAIEDFAKVRNAMAQGGYDEAKAALQDYSDTALRNFRRVQAELERFDTDEAAQEYLELMRASNNFGDEAVEDFLKIQKASQNLSDEAVEDFMKMSQAMQEVGESSRAMGGGVAGMTSQFTYMLSDAPMLLMDVRMGMMGIMNNIQPMMTMWGQNAAAMGGNMAVMKSLAKTMMGPAGLAAALSAVVFVAPQLIDFFKKDKKAAEDAKKAHEEYRKELKNISETISIETLKDRKEETEDLIKIQKDDLKQAKARKEKILEEKKANEELITAVDDYIRAKKVKEKADEDETSALVASMVPKKDYKKLINDLGYSIEEAKEKVRKLKQEQAELNEEDKDGKFTLQEKINKLEQDIEKNKELIPQIEMEISQRKRLNVGLAENKEGYEELVEVTGKFLPIITRLNIELSKGLGESNTELSQLEQKWWNIYTKSKEYADEWTGEKMDFDFGVQEADESIDKIQAVKDELPVVTGLFDRFGSTAQQAVNNTSDALEILKRTLISTGIEVASLMAMFKALKFFGGDVFSGISLGDFLLNQLFGKALPNTDESASGAASSATQNVDVGQIAQALNQRPVEVKIDGEGIPVKGIMKGRDMYLINEKAKKELA